VGIFFWVGNGDLTGVVGDETGVFGDFWYRSLSGSTFFVLLVYTLLVDIDEVQTVNRSAIWLFV